MDERFINRENKIFEILQDFLDVELEFVLVGGYAVSAYKHRFSIDADIVIKKEDTKNFEEVLLKKNFKRIISKRLEHVYASEFIRYETKDELPVSIDLLIDGVGSRTTDGSFSFDQLMQHSKDRKIIGTEKEVTSKVPQREILIVLKIHSGRLTDFRDIVALTKNLDIDLIHKLIWIGKKDIVKKNLNKLLSLLEDKGFVDSFKGVFIEKKYDVDLDGVRRLKELL